MSNIWCDKCPLPGTCCRDLNLRVPDHPDDAWFSFWEDEDHLEKAKALMVVRGLPFEPLRVSSTHEANADRKYVRYNYRCTKLVNGRCSIYEDRPQVCKDYTAGSDPMCVFTKKGVVRKKYTDKINTCI